MMVLNWSFSFRRWKCSVTFKGCMLRRKRRGP